MRRFFSVKQTRKKASFVLLSHQSIEFFVRFVSSSRASYQISTCVVSQLSSLVISSSYVFFARL